MVQGNFMTGSNAGRLILQAAQGIIAQTQRQQQLDQQFAEFENRVKQQEKLESAKAAEIKARENALKVKNDIFEKTFQAREAGFIPGTGNAPLAAQAFDLRSKIEARGGGGPGGKGGTGITGNESLDLFQSTRNTIRADKFNEGLQRFVETSDLKAKPELRRYQGREDALSRVEDLENLFNDARALAGVRRAGNEQALRDEFNVISGYLSSDEGRELPIVAPEEVVRRIGKDFGQPLSQEIQAKFIGESALLDTFGTPEWNDAVGARQNNPQKLNALVIQQLGEPSERAKNINSVGRGLMSVYGLSRDDTDAILRKALGQ